MRKIQILEKFDELNDYHWGKFGLVKHYAERLTKSECLSLLVLAEMGYTEFRLFDSHGYALDADYNRIYAYDHRRSL